VLRLRWLERHPKRCLASRRPTQLHDLPGRLAAARRFECRTNRLAELCELAHAENSFDHRANDSDLIDVA
jgi:hypothetical protein